MDYTLLVRNVLINSCEVESSLIQENSDLQRDLGLDSMGLLTLVTELENHFGKAFDFSLESAPKTVGELVRYLEENV